MLSALVPCIVIQRALFSPGRRLRPRCNRKLCCLILENIPGVAVNKIVDFVIQILPVDQRLGHSFRMEAVRCGSSSSEILS